MEGLLEGLGQRVADLGDFFDAVERDLAVAGELGEQAILVAVSDDDDVIAGGHGIGQEFVGEVASSAFTADMQANDFETLLLGFGD